MLYMFTASEQKAIYVHSFSTSVKKIVTASVPHSVMSLKRGRAVHRRAINWLQALVLLLYFVHIDQILPDGLSTALIIQ